MSTTTEIYIEPYQVWESADGQHWLILPEDDFRTETCVGIDEHGHKLRFWRSGKVAYGTPCSPRDLVCLAADQSITITPKANRS